MTTPDDTFDDLRLLTTKEVAALLRVERHKIYEAVKLGHLRAVPIAGPSSHRFRRVDVVDYVNQLAEGRIIPIQEKPEPAPITRGSGRRRRVA